MSIAYGDQTAAGDTNANEKQQRRRQNFGCFGNQQQTSTEAVSTQWSINPTLMPSVLDTQMQKRKKKNC
ncbi:hypothetical protein V9T40_000742 [Parthenolecanium corni]|uniref:Uncharacterized protein n=1 Tax=Parthenolecanium corni TaxID=536013 RepID=A0AAN9TDX9_9HEMI